MEQLNNLDVFFLVIVGISALVGIARGFTKESLSLVGWIVAGASVYFLTPVVNPIMQNYIASEMLSKAVSGMLVLLAVCVFWVLAVDKISSSIRQSKLGPLDRIFGLGFGFLRGALVVILLVMMISSLIPEDSKKGMFAASKIFVASEDFVEPVKSLIPQETMDSMQAQMEKLGLGSKKAEDEEQASSENKKDEKPADKAKEKQEKKDEKAPKNKEEKKKSADKPKEVAKDANDAFLELAQPKIENAEDVEKLAKDAKKAAETFNEMSDDLQKLMDSITDQTIEVNDEDFGL